jgi:hypothetical protein
LELARSMQVVGAEEADRGNFRWRLGDSDVTDANACEFAGQLLALLRLEDDGRLVPRKCVYASSSYYGGACQCEE